MSLASTQSGSSRFYPHSSLLTIPEDLELKSPSHDLKIMACFDLIVSSDVFLEKYNLDKVGESSFSKTITVVSDKDFTLFFKSRDHNETIFPDKFSVSCGVSDTCILVRRSSGRMPAHAILPEFADAEEVESTSMQKKSKGFLDLLQDWFGCCGISRARG